MKFENTYLTSQRVGILQRLVNLTLLKVILWSLSFHLLVKLLLILHLFGLDTWESQHMKHIPKLEERRKSNQVSVYKYFQFENVSVVRYN